MHDDVLHSSEKIDTKGTAATLNIRDSVTRLGLSETATKQLFFSSVTACHCSSPRFQYSPKTLLSSASM